MKTFINTTAVVLALAVSTATFAQNKSTSPANYKQQNTLVGKKSKPAESSQIAISNDYTTNPLENHRNYKANVGAPKANTEVYDVKLGNRHKNYKQKNLLTESGYKNATKQEENIEQEGMALK